jgi:hypothetical protein
MTRLSGFPTLLRQAGRHLTIGVDPQPRTGVRGVLALLACGAAAFALAPSAAGDSTTTNPAPDPNPPAGVAPDPYSPPAHATRTAPRPAPRPSYSSTPAHTYLPVHTVATSGGRPASTPRPARPHKAHPAVRHARHKRKQAARSRPLLTKAPVIRLTAARSGVEAAAVEIHANAAGEGDRLDRRRAAALALTVLVAASLSFVLLTARATRERSAAR